MYKNQYFNIFNVFKNIGELIFKYNFKIRKTMCTFYNQIAFEIQNVYKKERINSKLEV